MGWIKARKRGLKASPVSPGIRNCVSLPGDKRKFPGWFVNESTDIFFSRGQLKTVILTTVVVSFSSRYLFFVLMQIFVKKYVMVQWAPAVVAALMAVGIRRWTAVVLWWAVAGEIPVKNALWQTQVKWNENREVSCLRHQAISIYFKKFFIFIVDEFEALCGDRNKGYKTVETLTGPRVQGLY